MDSKTPHSQAGFLQSINLMLLGGLLLLAVIVASNKLLIHYVYANATLPNNWLGNLAKTESKTFSIVSSTDLYLTWFALLLSLVGMISVIIKLVRTWED